MLTIIHLMRTDYMPSPCLSGSYYYLHFPDEKMRLRKLNDLFRVT